MMLMSAAIVAAGIQIVVFRERFFSSLKIAYQRQNCPSSILDVVRQHPWSMEDVLYPQIISSESKDVAKRSIAQLDREAGIFLTSTVETTEVSDYNENDRVWDWWHLRFLQRLSPMGRLRPGLRTLDDNLRIRF